MKVSSEKEKMIPHPRAGFDGKDGYATSFLVQVNAKRVTFYIDYSAVRLVFLPNNLCFYSSEYYHKA